MLKGAIEIEVSSGIIKQFNKGDIILAEDLTGKGHITRSTSKGPREYLALPLASQD